MNLCLWWLAAADLCYLLSLASTHTAGRLVELVDPEFFKRFDAYSRVYVSGRLSMVSGCCRFHLSATIGKT